MIMRHSPGRFASALRSFAKLRTEAQAQPQLFTSALLLRLFRSAKPKRGAPRTEAKEVKAKKQRHREEELRSKVQRVESRENQKKFVSKSNQKSKVLNIKS
uniref:Uncharacterized protein n=1 Tax=Lacunastrum gracillimum TaxID=427913 RepID=A0A2U8GHA2_9CHLO|nr:hypothetical protein [Lacunastrum gracillimum]AWI68072.1 hypothetical protein [Lacunastrum gracillimum]